MKFSEDLWQTINPIYQQIIAHPFNIELAKGTLDKKRFIFYLEQDAYYLTNFSKVLALIAGRSHSTEMIQQFLHFSFGALISEKELHTSFLSSTRNENNIDPSLSCVAYNHYLIAQATTATLEEAVAAVLPCFWIYKEVGQHIAAYCHQDNPYIKWIETYSSQEFSQGTTQAIYLLDQLASHSSQKTLACMKKAFKYSALFEWHFWDHAYKMTTFTHSLLEAQKFLVKNE